MATAMYIKTTVLPGGKIEVSAPEFIEGQQATVLLFLKKNRMNRNELSLRFYAITPVGNYLKPQPRWMPMSGRSVTLGYASAAG